MVIELQLSRGKVAIIDEIDADLAAYKWSAKKKRDRFYAFRTIRKDGKMFAVHLHQAIYQRMHITDGSGHVDHANNDPLDNRRENLRYATPSQTRANSKIPSDNTSGYKGVVKHGKKWRAQIRADGKNYYLGLFDDPAVAGAIYEQAAIDFFGEYARIS